MRDPDDPTLARRSPRSGSRSRAWLIGVVVVLVALVLSARAIAGFYTDFLWFESVDHTEVWSKVLVTKVGLSIAFTLAFFLILYGNLLIADRLAPSGPRGPEDEMLARYHEFVAPRQGLLRFGVAAVFALIAGVGASGQWNNWLLFRHGGSFGVTDPLHDRDIGFYIFKLPFVNYVLGWAFAATVIVLMVVTVVHYLNGGIRLQVSGQRVTPQVKAHLSVLFALLALFKAADYWLQRYELLLSDRGVVRGATYTDVNAQLPAISLLLLISILSAVLFIVNIRQRGWTLPIVALGLWALVAVVAGAMYPWFIQTFQVARKESAREAPYIERNIDGTRAAMGLSDVKENNFDYTALPEDATISDNAETVRNIRLLDPGVVDRTFRSLESQLNFYRFTDMDVDRYPIGPGGAPTQVVLATRELNPTAIPEPRSWEREHLIYTHGYGVALAPANAVTTKGRPKFLIGSVPLETDASVAEQLPIERPEIYFGNDRGDDAAGYAIVRTTRQEQSGQAEAPPYEGDGGVPIDGLARRMAFFLRFGDLETLTSDFITRESRVIYLRDVAQRVEQVAPFLEIDNDPYPVITEGRIKYVVDAYTTASTYPYAERADTSQLEGTADLRGEELNYLRNSVKGVVDAYDGTIDLYMSDELYGERDPVIRAYADAFPDLLRPIDEMPEDLRTHLRYPEDLFRVQTAMWGRYHIPEPDEFYDASDRWDVAQDPGREVRRTATQGVGSFDRIAPYYLQMRLPNEEDESFLLFRPFVPTSNDDSKRQLVSFMVGTSDPGNYGQLQTYTMTQVGPDGDRERNRDVDGPLIVNDNILSDTNTQVSQTISLLEGGGSTVDFGNLLIVPIDTALMYIRPIYVRAAAEDAVPELRKVVVSVGDRVEVGDTLQEALRAIFPEASIETDEIIPGPESPIQPGEEPEVDPESPEPPAAPGPPTPPAGGSDPVDLIAQALALFAEADAALRDGGAEGFTTYEERIAEAEELIRQAQRALGGAAAPIGAESSTSVPDDG